MVNHRYHNPQKNKKGFKLRAGGYVDYVPGSSLYVSSEHINTVAVLGVDGDFFCAKFESK